jgi:hypothetical protein
MMHRLIAISAFAILITGPAFAAGKCSTAPSSQFKSQSDPGGGSLKTEGLHRPQN